MTLGLGTLIVGAISAGISLWQHYENKESTEEQYDQNYNFQEKTRNETWYREDNQIQRAKADAEAAGFSPLAALGNTAVGGGTVSAPSATAQQTPVDISGLVNALATMYTSETQAKTAKETTESNNETAKEIAKIQAGESKANRESTTETADKDRRESARQFNENLDNLKKQQRTQNKQKNRELTTAEGILSEQTRANKESEEIEWAKMYQEWYKENKLDDAPMGKQCKTWEEYERDMNTWYSNAKIFLDTLGFDEELTTTNGEIENINTNLMKILGSKAETTNSKTGKMSTYTQSERQWELWLRSNPQPIPPYPTREKKTS